MNIILFLSGLMIAAASVYVWCQDKENAKVYKFVFIIAMGVSVIEGMAFMSQIFSEKYYPIIMSVVISFIAVAFLQKVKKICRNFLPRSRC